MVNAMFKIYCLQKMGKKQENVPRYSRRTLKWSIILAKRFEKSSVFRAVNDNSEQWFCRNETDRTGEDSNLLGNVELNPNCEPECSECFFKKSTSAPCCGRVAWKLFVRKSWICDLRDQQPGCFAQHGCVALRRTLPNTNNTFWGFLNFQFFKNIIFSSLKKNAYTLFTRGTEGRSSLKKINATAHRSKQQLIDWNTNCIFRVFLNREVFNDNSEQWFWRNEIFRACGAGQW